MYGCTDSTRSLNPPASWYSDTRTASICRAVARHCWSAAVVRHDYPTGHRSRRTWSSWWVSPHSTLESSGHTSYQEVLVSHWTPLSPSRDRLLDVIPHSYILHATQGPILYIYQLDIYNYRIVLPMVMGWWEGFHFANDKTYQNARHIHSVSWLCQNWSYDTTMRDGWPGWGSMDAPGESRKGHGAPPKCRRRCRIVDHPLRET